MATDIITTISPTTDEPILTRQECSDAELEAIPTAAVEAFRTFSKTSLKERQTIVAKALDLMEDRKDELAKELTEQMGRPIAYTAKEITTAVARGRYMLKISTEALAATEGEPEQGFRRYIKKVSLGPVLVIFAWNVSTFPSFTAPPHHHHHHHAAAPTNPHNKQYPYLILINSIIPALLAGDVVILKPSPQTPTVAEQAQRIFTAAGLPPNVMQNLHCGTVARLTRLIQSPSIKLICFTGSVSAGLAVQRAASDAVEVRVGLELGGKDAAYIRPDVDVAWAAEEVVDGAVFNSGQSCCSIERVYVHEAVHDDFVAAVQRVLQGYRLGDPGDAATHVGPVVSRRAAETIRSHVADALAKGARDATPANESFDAPPARGNYVKPTLLTHVTHDMDVMTEETFGPVIPVMKVGGDEEAVRLMNDCEFGLTASIWTRDVDAGHALAEDVEAGTVFVNRCDYPSPDLAWVGWKNSGKGQTLSRFGFDQFVKLKSYHVKDYPK